MHLGELFKKLGLGRRHIFFALLSIFVTVFTFAIWVYQLNYLPKKTHAAAATCYWVGDTNPANWNDASHWSSASGGAGSTCDGGVVPGSDDTVIFDSANANSATIDADVSVASMTNVDYVGTLTNTTYAVSVSGTATYKSGNLSMGSATWTFSNGWDVRGATITSGTSTLVFDGSVKRFYGNKQTFNNVHIVDDTDMGSTENTDQKNFYVDGTLTIDAGKRLKFTYRSELFMNNGSSAVLNGNFLHSAGSEKAHFIDSAGANVSGAGTIGVPAYFETETQNVTVPALTSYYTLSVINSSASNYIATLGTAAGQTITVGTTGNFSIAANGDGNITIDADTYDPTVLVYSSGSSTEGDLDFTGTGAGTEILNAGSSNWTIDRDMNLTDGQFSAGNSTFTFRSGGGQNPILTTNGYSFYNLRYIPTIVNKTLTFADAATISGTLTCTGGALTPTLKFTAGLTYTVANLAINGSYSGVTYYRATIKSSVDTSSFNFNVSQTKPRVTYVNVRDANSAGGNTINAAYSVDTVPGSTTNWTFLSTYTVSGTVYTAESKATNIGAAKTIGISVGGSPKETVESGAGGTFSFTVAFGDGEAMTIFEDDEGAEEMTLVTEAATPAANITGLEAYTNKVVLSHASAGPMTNAIMAYADSTLDDDIKYTITSGNATIIAGFELWIDATKTYTPGGTVDADGIDINGTFTVGANAVSNSGDWDATGGSFTSSGTVTMDGAVAQTLTSNTNSFSGLTIKTTHASGTILADALSVAGNLYLSADGASNVLLDAATNNPAVAVVGDIDYTGVGAGSESISMGTNTWTVTGNIDLTGGTITAGSSTLVLDGASPQSLTSASQSFNNITLTNTDAVSGVTFADDCTVTGTFTNITGDSITTFNDGETYAFNALNVAGTAGHLVNLVSAVPGTAWLLNVTEATPTADYVSATDSDASGGSAIDATTGGFNGGGNTNWLFAVATVTVSPASATLDQGATQTFTATAADAEGYNVPTATFAWSVVNGGGTITTPAGVFTAGTTAGTYTNTVQATSGGINGTASVTVNAAPTPTPTPTPEPTPEPSGDVCNLGNITQVSIQDSNFSVAPGGVKTLGITFLDTAGNPIDKSSVANFKMTPDYYSSYWNISKGGGRLTDENLDTINTNFIGGGTRGSFSNTIIFSACGGTLKAYATPEIVKARTIYADIDPDTYALQPGESFKFDVSLYDDAQNPVNEICSYSWSLSSPSAGILSSPAQSSTSVTANDSLGEYTLKADINCSGQSLSAQAALAIFKIDKNTEWKLNSYFSQLTSWEGQKTYVGFLSYVKVGSQWYFRSENLDYTMTDPAAAKVVGLHSKYPSIPIIEATKAGCYPFLVGATLNQSNKLYFASTSMNIGTADKASEYARFQPTLGDSILSYQHLVKKSGENGLTLRRRDTLGNLYPNYNWIYVGKSMTTKWVINDTRIGALRPYYDLAYLDTTNAQYGYFLRAITTIINFNGKEKVENWDIWIEKSTDKIRFSPSLPETIRIKPNSLFRLWQGYEYANWDEYLPAGYKVKSINQEAASLVNDTVTDIIFKSGEDEGTYQDAITLSSAYSTSSMIGGSERKINIIVDNTATADLCSANGFAQVLGVQSQADDEDSQSGKKSIGDILRDIWRAIVEAVQNMFRWLNNHAVTSLIIGFLLALPALLSILGTSVLANLVTSISRFFTGLTAAAIPGKKNRRLGYVYDWQSKKPIKGARVSAFNTFSKKLSYQTLTNAQGEFILVLPQGEYYLTVEKRGYKPYQTVSIESGERFSGNRSDGYYEAIYLPSEKIDIASGQEGFAHSIAIPLSRPAIKPNPFLVALIKLGGLISRMSLAFLIIGSIMTLGLIIYDHSNWVNIIILLYYILVWILYLYRHFTFFSGTARVVDQNGAGVDLALVRVFNDQSKLIQTVVSDRKGHFILNLVKGNYSMQIKKVGFATKETQLKVKNLADINRIEIVL